MWQQENLCTFKEFLCEYDNEKIVPTVETMQKVVDFDHKKGIDKLKFGCSLPHLANICLHKSASAKFYPVTENDRDLLENIREDMVGGPSIVFTQKPVVDKTFIRNSTNLCKRTVGIDASQLYPFSMFQAIATGLYTRRELDSKYEKFKLRQNETRSFENMVISYFQRVGRQCQMESFYTTDTQKKNDANSVDGFCGHCNTVLEAMGCHYHFFPCQEICPSLIEEEISEPLERES